MSAKPDTNSGKKAAKQPTTPAGKSATPPAGAASAAAASAGAFVPSLPANAKDVLVSGTSLHVTTSLGASFDCVLHCYDDVSQLLIVEIAYGFDDPLAYHDRPELSPLMRDAEAAVGGEGRKDITMLQAKQIRSDIKETDAMRMR